MGQRKRRQASACLCAVHDDEERYYLLGKWITTIVLLASFQGLYYKYLLCMILCSGDANQDFRACWWWPDPDPDGGKDRWLKMDGDVEDSSYLPVW